MNTKKILGIIAALLLVAVALVGAGVANAEITYLEGNSYAGYIESPVIGESVFKESDAEWLDEGFESNGLPRYSQDPDPEKLKELEDLEPMVDPRYYTETTDTGDRKDPLQDILVITIDSKGKSANKTTNDKDGTSAKTPMPFLGILAGLGAATLLIRRH